MMTADSDKSEKTIAFVDHAILRDFELSVSYSKYDATLAEPEHYHDFLELVLIAGGTGCHLFNGERFEVCAGNVFLIMPGQSHAYLNMEKIELYSILFFDRLLAPFRKEFELISGFHLLFNLQPNMAPEEQMRGSIYLPSAVLPQAVEDARNLRGTLKQQQGGCRIGSWCSFIQLLLLIVRNCQVRSESNLRYHHAETISRILSFIEQNYARPLSLEMLAAHVCMSVSNFRRIFTDAVGVAPMRYILELRLKKSAELLANHELPMSRIAFDTGFSDSNYFSHRFRQHFGMAPLQYRKQRFAK